SRTLKLTRPKSDKVAKRGEHEESPTPQGQPESGTTVVSRARKVPGSGEGTTASKDGKGNATDDNGNGASVASDHQTGKFSQSPDGKPANLPGDAPQANAGTENAGGEMQKDGETGAGGKQDQGQDSKNDSPPIDGGNAAGNGDGGNSGD